MFLFRFGDYGLLLIRCCSKSLMITLKGHVLIRFFFWMKEMWIHRPLIIRKSIGLRFFSQIAAAVVEEPVPLFTYLEDFPRPEPKYAETILAIPRSKSGKNISAKERKAGRVPSIVFEQLKGEEGGNKLLISVQTKQIRKLVNHLGYSFFLSRLFDLEVRSDFGSSDEIIERVRVLPRKVCYSCLILFWCFLALSPLFQLHATLLSWSFLLLAYCYCCCYYQY